jgi:hypothetical protein
VARKQGWPLGLSLAAASALLLGVGMLWSRQNSPAASETAALETETPRAGAVPSLLQPPIAPAPLEATTTPAAVSPVRSVKLTVQTEPAGAVLQKDGFQICDSTPCEIELETGAAVQLEATLGNRRGQTKVLAHKDQSVLIPLRVAGSKSKEARKQKLCEVTVGGLKILRPCSQ